MYSAIITSGIINNKGGIRKTKKYLNPFLVLLTYMEHDIKIKRRWKNN